MDTSKIEARKAEHLATREQIALQVQQRQQAIQQANAEINELQAHYNAVQGQLAEVEFWLALASADAKAQEQPATDEHVLEKPQIPALAIVLDDVAEPVEA